MNGLTLAAPIRIVHRSKWIYTGNGASVPEIFTRSKIMSRIVEFAKAGGPEVLEFKDIEGPTPADDEVRIRAKAIGINRAQAMWREDSYIEPVKFPTRLGYEAVCIVAAVARH